MKNIKALDFMIKNDLYNYRCDPWYRSPGDENYESVKDVNGQINYMEEVFVVSHSSGSSGSGGMDMGSPNSANITRIKT